MLTHAAALLFVIEIARTSVQSNFSARQRPAKTQGGGGSPSGPRNQARSAVSQNSNAHAKTPRDQKFSAFRFFSQFIRVDSRHSRAAKFLFIAAASQQARDGYGEHAKYSAEALRRSRTGHGGKPITLQVPI
jgi:hypothetical protein